MINSLVKVGIICPCNIEYQSCKEILKLHNETELAGRLISSRIRKRYRNNSYSSWSGENSMRFSNSIDY
ncbi:hypothetical protein KJ830_04700 [bacterium]|nr:hypothetical protein [bacterium]